MLPFEFQRCNTRQKECRRKRPAPELVRDGSFSFLEARRADGAEGVIRHLGDQDGGSRCALRASRTARHCGDGRKSTTGGAAA